MSLWQIAEPTEILACQLLSRIHSLLEMSIQPTRPRDLRADSGNDAAA